MAKTIFVNATASRNGGALTILNQFIKAFSDSETQGIELIIFCSVSLNSFGCNSITFIQLKPKNFYERLLWDYWGMKQWAKRHKKKPQLIISFQNTGVIFDKVPQIIYLHQAIPFTPVSWNFFKNEERQLWFYKHIYPFFISRTLFKQTHLIVQTLWMKNAVSKYFNFPAQKILVAKPAYNIPENSPSCSNLEKGLFHFIYPGTPFVYKNHVELIHAAKLLKDENITLFRIHLTCTFEELTRECRALISSYDIYANFVFHNQLAFDVLFQLYKQADCLLFPSKIETVGLPLLEAASVGMPILSADTEYAREILSNYLNVLFCAVDNPKEWANRMKTKISASKRVDSIKLVNGENDWDKVIKLIQSSLEGVA